VTISHLFMIGSTRLLTLRAALLVFLNGTDEMGGAFTDFSLADSSVEGDPFGNRLVGDWGRILASGHDISCNGHDQASENCLHWPLAF